MKQRMFIALAAVSLLVGVVVGPALAAGGGVARYQFDTTSYSIAVLDTYMHTFVVTANPCDGSIAITGSTPADGGYYTTETVTGTLANGVISFSSTYDGPYNPGFTWSGSFPVAGGALSGQYTGTVVAGPTTFSTFKNHGDYVSSQGGGPDAAHSCIGMPIRSHGRADAATTSDPASTLNESVARAHLAANEARLLSHLQDVLDKVDDSHAKSAIQRHIDAINGGQTGLGHAAQVVGGGADHPSHPDHPATPPQATDHPNKGNHSGKP